MRGHWLVGWQNPLKDRHQNIIVLCIAKHDTLFDCLVNSHTKTDPCPAIQAASADRLMCYA